jgi:hypothetical protein
MNPKKSARYSASPYGKRFDIYETSETEEVNEEIIVGTSKVQDRHSKSLPSIECQS